MKIRQLKYIFKYIFIIQRNGVESKTRLAIMRRENLFAIKRNLQ